MMYDVKERYCSGSEIMNERKWHWQEVAFIPKGIAPQDLLRVPDHIFIKSTVAEELMIKEEVLKEKKSEKHTKKKKRYGGFFWHRNHR